MSFNLLASFTEVLSYIGYIALAVLVLLVMITVHEFGHYIAGKIFGFGIEEFSIGFGPKLFSRKKKDGEVFSIRLFPLGGFCSFRGEDEESDKNDSTAFNNKKPWQRIIVLVSGAFMNYLLALILILIMLFGYGAPALKTAKIDLNPKYSAEYSLQDGDVIAKANGKNIYTLNDLLKATANRAEGDKVLFGVYRGGEYCEVLVAMRVDTGYKNSEDIKTLYSAIGVSYSVDENGDMIDPQMYSTAIKRGFFATIGHSFTYSFKLIGTIFTILGELLTGALGLSSLGGTVTTITTTATAIQIGGFRYLLNIASLIGVNLAVFNLLPLPALDGSRVVFTAIEWVRKKPISRKIEGIIHAVGMIALLLFAIIIDLQRCF